MVCKKEKHIIRTE